MSLKEFSNDNSMIIQIQRIGQDYTILEYSQLKKTFSQYTYIFIQILDFFNLGS